MNCARKYFALVRLWTLCALGLAPACLAGVGDPDIKLGTITADGETYSNVVVFSRSATHVSISHSRGMANIKAKSLDTPTQRRLGYLPPEEPKTSMPALINTEGVTDPRLLELQERYQRNVEEFIQSVDKKTLYEIGALIGIIYLFFCYCCMQICRKTSNRAGLFVWLPGFQMIPLLRAAGMSPWLFLLLCVPGINAIITIVWSFRICRVRQKSAFLGVLLLLPVTNVLAFVYLALSGYGPGDEEQQRDNGKIKLAFQSSS